VRRTVLLGTLAILAAFPASAAAQEKVCDVPTPAAAAERTLQDYIRVREYPGFRSDRAYVQSLLARGLRRTPVGDIPATPREARYLFFRERLALGAVGQRYLRKHPGSTAWWSVKDNWPNEPYIVVHVTGDPQRMLARLKPVARFPRNLRVERVRYSERELDRIENRINGDYGRLRKARFTLAGSEVNLDTNRIQVAVATRRTDAAAYFAKRYGPAVRTRVISPDPTLLECATAEPYEIAPDGMSLNLAWTTGGGAVTERIEVTEHPDRVEIGIVERVPVGARTLEGRAATAVAPLSAPLGARAVYDASRGARMLQTGPAPGDPPCPVRAERTELEQTIAQRAEYGMNADPAYVQALLADDREYTEPERKWLKRLQRLDYESGVSEYLTHWRKDWGGTQLVAKYPAKPYQVIRLVHHRAFHTKNLKRLTKWPGQLRTEPGKYPYDAIWELEQQIGDDAREHDGFFAGYGRDGYYVYQASGNDALPGVEVRVITTRPGAQEYFARRYGELAKVTVIGDRYECRGGYSG
jgi:hypothetical protein